MMYYRRTSQDSTRSPITVRPAGAGDAEALRRLAQRDSQSVPEGELVIALVDHDVRAAISPTTGATIADPFHRTSELVDMLTVRASQMRGAGDSPRWLRGLRWRRVIVASRTRPAGAPRAG